MKAYQIKITLDDSHPPIWRRAVIPAGLSFSQLIVILNEIMGWNGGHLSSFEFYDLKITIEEDPEDCWEDDYEVFEASTTLIDPYLDSEKSFTYVYDFGDNWSHRVTIEKVIPDYEQDYPMVLKFKENTPYEDCGGIWGYYHLLDILNDPSNPEYEDTREWAGDDSDRIYNLDRVNTRLKKFRLSDKKGNPLMSYDIYQEVMIKNHPLKQVNTHSKTDNSILSPEKFRQDSDVIPPKEMRKLYKNLEDYLYNLSQILAERATNRLPEHPENLTLKDVLSEMTKVELTEIAKLHSLSRYSKYKKLELADFISSKLLERDVLSHYFLYLEDEEIELLDRGLQKAEEVIQEWPCDPMYLAEGGYSMLLYGNNCLIPLEVWNTYKEICTSEWKEERKEKKELLNHLNAAVLLNGCCDIDTALSMYEKNTGIHKEKSDVFSLQKTVPSSKLLFFLQDGKIILEDFDNEKILKNLEKDHRGKTTYMPSPEEVKSLACRGYLKFDSYMENLKQFLVQNMAEEPEYAEDICMEIQEIIRMGEDVYGVLTFLEEMYGNEIDLSQNQLHQLFVMLENVWNHTRMVCHRGHTPDELHNKNSVRHISPEKSHGKIVDFAVCKPKKIYPNDPCPCGSGKKYKNCCGKRQ